ncbi:MAG: hypothetical protein Q8898_14125 [Bacillota bacterium]|nr:hypothetical protein [Bacillota bacterium]
MASILLYIGVNWLGLAEVMQLNESSHQESLIIVTQVISMIKRF